MKSRIRTYAGISFPPFEDDYIEKNGYLYMQIAIKGRIPSKKNNIVIKVIFKHAIALFKTISLDGKINFKQLIECLRKVESKIIGNIKYFKFLEQQKPLILAQMQEYAKRWEAQGIIFPLTKCQFKCQFYFIDKYKQDLINKAQTVQDLLVHTKVISDDSCQILNPVYLESRNFKDELRENQALITLTFNKKDNV